MPKPPPSVPAETWEFYRKHSVLGSVSLWLVSLPLFGMQLVDRFTGRDAAFGGTALHRFLLENDPWGLSTVLAYTFLTAAVYWGVASVLVVSRRMLGHPAGRARTSLHSVRKEAFPYAMPLFATSILRDCETLLWGLIFLAPVVLMLLTMNRCSRELFTLVPAVTGGTMSPITAAMRFFTDCPLFLLTLPLLLPTIWFRLRTVFFWTATVGDDSGYREAFRASNSVMHNRFWKNIGMYALSLALFQGTTVVGASVLDRAFALLAPRYVLVGDFLGSVIVAFGMTLFFIALTIQYARARERTA